MALIEFEDLPSTNTPINAENLNNNFNSIIESGSDENGRWVKFADGTMICHGTTSPITTPANNGTYLDITLPASFINTDYEILGTIKNGQTYWANLQIMCYAITGGQFRFWVWNSASGSSENQTFSYMTIGRWK